MDLPDPQYAKTADGAYIAYQVVGDGPVDVAWQLDFGGSLDVWWEFFLGSVWFEELASFARLILHDWRGTGLSSRNVAVANMETRAADLLAVLDAAGSTSTVLGAWSEGLAPCVLLAASQPARVRALVWWNPQPRTAWAPDYPWGDGPAELARERAALSHWGTEQYSLNWADVTEATTGLRPPEEADPMDNQEESQHLHTGRRGRVDRHLVRDRRRGILPAVQAPTLLIVDDEVGYDVAVAEYVASLMPRALRSHSSRVAVWPSGEQLRPVRRAPSRRGPPLHRIDASPGGPRLRPRDGAVHRHRRIDRARGRGSVTAAWQRARRTAPRRSCERCSAATAAREIDTHGRRALCHVRRTGESGAVRTGDRRIASRSLGVEIRAGCHTGEVELPQATR